MESHAVPSTPPKARAGSPAFLTVEEAAAVLRIGRTAAYLLARRWEETGGAEGLPVVRFGRLLRTPVHELERLAGGAIDLAAEAPSQSDPVREPMPAPKATPNGMRRARRPTRKADVAQASLFPNAS
jgi:hypothetical protein